MTAYDRTVLAKLIAQVESMGRHGTNRTKGTAMADLVAHIFGEIPGVQLRHREFLAPDMSSEIDLVFRNQPQVSGLFDGVTLHMECKNERRRISAEQVRVFASKLRDRNQPVGVIISRTGLAGRPGGKTHAHGVVGSELATGRSIVVLALADLVGLDDTDRLVDLCIERRFELEAFGTYNSI
jgi:hypothetical protein